MGLLGIDVVCGGAITTKRRSTTKLEFPAQLELLTEVGDTMAFINGAPYNFPAHLEVEAEVIDEWLQSCKCTERQRKRILSCLDVQYLRRIPIVGKSRPWPKDLVNRNYRYDFRAQVSHILR